MSLVIALKGTDSVVLAADTLAVSEDPDGMCKFKCTKLRTVNDGRWVVGVTGSDDAFGLIETLNRRGFDFGHDALTCIIREVEGARSLLCYKHVIKTVFGATEEASA